MSGYLQDSNGNSSSKRLWGSIGMGLFFLSSVFAAFYSIYTGRDIGAQAAGLIISVGATSGGLLGIGVFETKNNNFGGQK